MRQQQSPGQVPLSGNGWPSLGQARRVAQDDEHHVLCRASTVRLASLGSLLCRLAANSVTVTRSPVTFAAA